MSIQPVGKKQQRVLDSPQKTRTIRILHERKFFFGQGAPGREKSGPSEKGEYFAGFCELVHRITPSFLREYAHCMGLKIPLVSHFLACPGRRCPMKSRGTAVATLVLTLLTCATAYGWVAVTVDSADNAGGIALDSLDKAHISYYAIEGSDTHLMYGTNATGSWVTDSLDAGYGVGMASSVAVDSSDKVHICYSGGLYGGLEYATNVTGSWLTETVDSGMPGLNGRGIAIDNSDDVHIAYTDGLDLKYATNALGSWAIESVDSPSTGVAALSLALDGSGKAHIVYIHGMPPACTVSYATNASDSWLIETADTTTDPNYVSNAVDSLGKVHACYNDGEAPDLDLKYATNVSGSWFAIPVDSVGEYGGHGSIAVDSSDDVHLSYAAFDSSAQSVDLKHATNASGSWVASTVDSSGDAVGWSTSIALDSLNRVHVSYFAFMDYQIKYVLEECVAEECINGVDDDCDGDIDAADADCQGYSTPANAEASTYGGQSLSASGSFNALSLLFVPLGVFVALRVCRRKR
jgi:hypothetical protein